ncbi:MAG: LysR substrate-binding domain-containing protein, partial [Bacillota bacterium]
MELHHLRYFVSVARHGNFTRAAEENHVAQPSLSQQIRRLEEELGAPLFDRSVSPVRLTDAGEALLPHAEAILQQTAAARAAVEERLGLRSGRLLLGTLPQTGSRLLPVAVAAFRERYPGVAVVLREESTERLTELALAGETDLTLTTLPVGHPELATEPLLTEEILLALPPSHPLAGSPSLPLTAVAEEPFLIMKPGYAFRDQCLAACRAAGFEPRVAFESTQIDTIQAMVSAGLGVTLVPRMAAEQARRPAPAFIRLEGPPLTRTLALAWRRDRYLSRAATAFLEVARG